MIIEKRKTRRMARTAVVTRMFCPVIVTVNSPVRATS